MKSARIQLRNALSVSVLTLRTKYILRAALLLLIGLMGVLWYVGKNVKSPSTRSVTAQQTVEKTDPALLAEVSRDTDSDGLKDWEEVLWKTAPQNADSDGDGMPDGAEVAAGRDPNKKGPTT